MTKSWFADSSVEDIIAASAIEPIGPIAWQKIYTKFHSLKEVYATKESELINFGLTTTQAWAIKHRITQAKAQLRLLEKKQISLVRIDDDDYPKLLREINDPPLWLYYRGDLACLSRPTLTVVGSRKPSGYALTVLEQLLPDGLVGNITIVSGLAYGTDKAAHLRSIKLKQPTAAVLAGGLDSIYPCDHTQLAEKIIEYGGVLLSEYPPLSRPLAYRFPVRNRIIAGLSPATVIVEAALKSGTMTTAKSALEYNRDLFAIPADITRKNAEGNNFLLEKGAAVLRTAQTLFDYYGLKNQSVKHEIDIRLKKLLDLLTDEPKTVDQLLLTTKRPVEQILVDLTQLELMGLVYQPTFGCYSFKK